MSDHISAHLLKKRPTRRVSLVLCLTASYMFLEFLGGLMSHSLALLADAGHMLADVCALSISLVAFVIASRPPNYHASFGYYRAEVLAALFNGVVLLLVSFFIIKEAILRFFSPVEVLSGIMMWVALGGLLVNLIGLSLLHKDKAHNLNIKGAWLHVMSDTLGSIGAVISALLIYFLGWNFADSITSIIIAALVSYNAIHLILETVHVLMEHTPSHIDAKKVQESLLALKHVIKVHDLHIWSITSNKQALSVHVVADDGANYNLLLKEIQAMLDQIYKIDHSTIQIENECQVKIC